MHDDERKIKNQLPINTFELVHKTLKAHYQKMNSIIQYSHLNPAITIGLVLICEYKIKEKKIKESSYINVKIKPRNSRLGHN